MGDNFSVLTDIKTTWQRTVRGGKHVVTISILSMLISKQDESSFSTQCVLIKLYSSHMTEFHFQNKNVFSFYIIHLNINLFSF